MTLLDDDAGVAARLLDHIANATTDRGASGWREPVANYLQADRYDAELAVLRCSNTVFCPSAALPEAGSFVAREVAGVPLFATRGTDGKVHAFRNVCRHRGMRVVSGEGCANAHVCPYHGWTYGLDGALKHVPHESGFPDLDREARGLVEVGAAERNGLVFVNQDGPADLDPLLSEIGDVISKEHQLRSTIETDEPVNWKILLETFLEGYHIRFLHRTTFYPVQYDNLNVVEFFGSNIRVTYPYRNIERLEDVPPTDRTLQGRVTFVYQLFPNAIIATFPDLTLLILLEPQAVDRTRVVTHALVREQAVVEQGSEPPDGSGEGSTLLLEGGDEDFAAARSVQRGLASGANQFHEFGRYESAIGHFHYELDLALEGPAQ